MPDSELAPVAPRRRGSRFRGYFVTGLLALVPLWATIYIVMFVVRVLGGYLSPLFRELAFLLVGPSAWLGPVELLADILAFVITVLLIAALGLAVKQVFGERTIGAVNVLLGRIPVIREIYSGVQSFSEALFGDKTTYRRVVAVQYPNEHTWRVGFITSSTQWEIPEGSGIVHMPVFVPTTPNATSGFLLLVKAQEVVPLSLSVDEALKFIVSGGTLSPGRFQISRES